MMPSTFAWVLALPLCSRRSAKSAREFISSIPLSLPVAGFLGKTKSRSLSIAANQPESQLPGLPRRNVSAPSLNSMVLTAGFLLPPEMELRLSAMQPHRPILPGDAVCP
jgi:hypothetical protein